MNTKDRILEELEARHGESVSGEQMASELGISRNAVWKAVKQLQTDGYDIIAARNRGYALSDENDVLSARGIERYLSLPMKAYAKRIKIYDSLESTNKSAKEMAISGAEHGTVVIADAQTAGRGRYSRKFFSKRGDGLYMSMILRPEMLSYDDPTALTACAAVAVCEAIEAVTEREPRIKWVNDVYVDGKKVCGILTEAVSDFESGCLEWIVLGIGINVYVREEDFPIELRDTAASLCRGKKMFDTRNRLCAEIMNKILDPNMRHGEKEMFKKYKERLMLGREITVIQNNDEYGALALDIDEKGRLIVKKENGELATLSSGEISIRQK